MMHLSTKKAPTGMPAWNEVSQWKLRSGKLKPSKSHHWADETSLAPWTPVSPAGKRYGQGGSTSTPTPYLLGFLSCKGGTEVLQQAHPWKVCEGRVSVPGRPEQERKTKTKPKRKPGSFRINGVSLSISGQGQLMRFVGSCYWVLSLKDGVAYRF